MKEQISTIQPAPENTEARPLRNALVQRIAAFAQAGDRRDGQAMQDLVHDAFRMVAFLGESTTPVVLDKPGYLAGLAAGKLGGTERRVDVDQVDVFGNQASCRVRLASEKMKFETNMHWVFTAGKWCLMNDLTQAVPVSAQAINRP